MNPVSVGGDSGITQTPARERHQDSPEQRRGKGKILSAGVHSASEGYALTRSSASIRPTMNIEVGNVSYTGAIISWSSSEPCLEDYYHIMYRPNWNSIFSGYLRYSFHHEEKVPRAIRSVVLEHLAPSTFYFLCVSCKKITFPYRHYCTMFHTLDKSPLAAGSSLVDPQISLWVLMAILLACFTAVLAFICLQFWCIRCHEPRWSYRAGHMEEANGLVRWPEEAPPLGQREEDLQGLPLVEMPRKDSGAGADPEAEDEADQEAPDGGALPREGADPPAILPHFEE